MKLMLAIGAGMLGYFYSLGLDVRRRRALRREEIGRWEGEGGNAPGVATPTPAPLLQSPYPPAGSGARH